MPITDVEELASVGLLKVLEPAVANYLLKERVVDYVTLREVAGGVCYDSGKRRDIDQRIEEAQHGGRPIPAWELRGLKALLWDEWCESKKAYALTPDHFAGLYATLCGEGAYAFDTAAPPIAYVGNSLRAGSITVIDGDKDWGKTAMGFTLDDFAIQLWEQHEALVAEGRPMDSPLARFAIRCGVPRAELEQGFATGKWRRPIGLVASRGLRIATNIAVDVSMDPRRGRTGVRPYSDYYQPCARLSDLWICANQNANDGYFTRKRLDEAGGFYKRARQMSNENIWIDDSLRMDRKDNSATELTTQYLGKDLPGYITDPSRGARTVIEKLSQTEAIFTIRGGVPQLYHRRVTDIPDTRLAKFFVTEHRSSFKIDFAPRQCLEEIELQAQIHRLEHGGQIWSLETTRARTIDWLRRLQEGRESQQALKLLVIDSVTSDNPATGKRYTTEELMEEFGVDRRFVRECVAASKRVKSIPRSPDKPYVRERVLQRMDEGATDAQIAEEQGVNEEFVANVRKLRGAKPSPGSA